MLIVTRPEMGSFSTPTQRDPVKLPEDETVALQLPPADRLFPAVDEGSIIPMCLPRTLLGRSATISVCVRRAVPAKFVAVMAML